MTRNQKARRQRLQIILTIVGLITLAGAGMTLNWIAYSAWVCETVPNHYSCN